MSKKLRLIGIIMVMSMLVLTACGKSTEDTSKKETEEVTEVVEEVETEEPQSENSEESKEDDELHKLTIGYGNHLGCVLYFIAQEEGLFEEYGLDVDLQVLPGGAENAAALQTGKLDAASLGSTQAFSLISQGQDLVIYGGQMHEGSGIITLTENKELMSDFKNYKGKTIGLVRMATGDVVFRKGLIDAGLEIGEDVNIVELDSAATITEAVKKGEIDAGGSWIPHLSNAVSQGLEISMLSGEVMPNHPCAIMVGMRDNLEENKEAYSKLHMSLIRAFEIFENDQDKSIEYIQKYLDLDTEVLKEDAYGRYSPNPEINIDAATNFWNSMNEIGYIESDININEHIDESYYNKAMDEIIKEFPENEFYKEIQKGGYGSHAE